MHFEFQTTETDWKDLLRFEAYEAVTAHKREKKVLTYVISAWRDCGCSDRIKLWVVLQPRVEPVYLAGYDADKIFKRL